MLHFGLVHYNLKAKEHKKYDSIGIDKLPPTSAFFHSSALANYVSPFTPHYQIIGRIFLDKKRIHRVYRIGEKAVLDQ